MKKILLMNLTPRGGMLHYGSQFSNALGKRQDITQKVAIASYADISLYDISDYLKIRTKPNKYSFFIDSINILYHAVFIYRIIKFKPDIVHFLDNHPWYILYSRIFKFFGYTIYTTQHDPIIHSGEDTGLQGKIAGYVNKALRKNSDKIMVNGDTLKKEMIEKYNISENKIVSIKHGSYTFFNTWAKNLATQKNTFLFFGRIVDYKGLDVLLGCLNQVQEVFPDFCLIIAGYGSLTSYQEKLDRYKENIKIYNFEIQAEDAYKYFEVSEFVVLPYKDASGSGVIPVAYCFSKPVIVTDVGELASVVEKGKTGYIISSNNSELLGEKIIEILKDKEKAISMGKAGKIFSDEILGWEDIINKIYEK